MVIHSQSLYLVSIQDADRKKKGGGERSDSIMILSINPKTKKTEIVSIPRDTRAEIVGRGTTVNCTCLCIWWTKYGQITYQ